MKKFKWMREDEDITLGAYVSYAEETPRPYFRLSIGDKHDELPVCLDAEELASVIDGMLDVLCSAREKEKKPEPAVTVPDRGQPHIASCRCADCGSCSW